MSKKGIAKVVAGAVFVGGITFAGVNYTGGDAVDNITNKSNELQDRFEQASADVTYLQGEFDALNDLYADDMVEANAEISKLISTAVNFREQIRSLQAEIEAGNTDNSTAQEEIQSEITRLEQALTEANNDIADLEAHILQIESETQYDPVNKEVYEAKDLGMPYEVDFVSLDAYEFNYDRAVLFAENVIGLMEDISHEIIGVDVYNIKGSDTIVYVVSDETFPRLQSNSKKTSRRTTNKLTSGNLYFVNESKTHTRLLNSSGYYF